MEMLTTREKQVAGLLYLPNKKIASQLNIAPATVKVIARHINDKLGVLNRTQAYALWLQAQSTTQSEVKGEANVQAAVEEVRIKVRLLDLTIVLEVVAGTSLQGRSITLRVTPEGIQGFWQA